MSQLTLSQVDATHGELSENTVEASQSHDLTLSPIRDPSNLPDSTRTPSRAAAVSEEAQSQPPAPGSMGFMRSPEGYVPETDPVDIALRPPSPTYAQVVADRRGQ